MKLLILSLLLGLTISNKAGAAPTTRQVYLWQLLAQISSTPLPSGCHMMSIIDGTKIDKALSYPFTLESASGDSDSIVLSKDAEGSVSLDSEDSNSPHKWIFSEGGRTLQMIITPQGMTYIQVGNLTCGSL